MNQLLTIHYYIFQNNLFGKMNLHKNSEPHRSLSKIPKYSHKHNIINIVSIFSLDLLLSQEKIKAILVLMQNFGGTNKECYGIFENRTYEYEFHIKWICWFQTFRTWKHCWWFGQQKNWELSKINVWHNEGNKHPSRYRRKLDEWMSHFQSLHSNEPLNPNQEMITNDLRNLEQELTLQFHALYYLINQTKIRIAVKKLKHNKSFSDKIKNKRVKSAVKWINASLSKIIPYSSVQCSPTANDSQTANDPQIGLQMIPNRK